MPHSSRKPLHVLFHPRTVAIVGASSDESKRGYRVTELLQRSGFKGEIYPVNPRLDSLLGLRVFKSLESIGAAVDVVVVCTPAQTLPSVIEECSNAGAGFAIIFAAGLSETEDGRAISEQVLSLAGESGLRIVGPNTLGLFSYPGAFNVTSKAFFPQKEGGLSVISQSGSMGMEIMKFTDRIGLPINKFVGSGNEDDLVTADFLDYFATDAHTQAVAVFMEGLRDGTHFLRALRACGTRKPTIVMKVGRSNAGARATQSHTGSIAVDERVFHSVIKQARAFRANSITELLDMAITFSVGPKSPTRNAGIVCWGGGLAVHLADACEEAGLVVVRLTDGTTGALRKVMPREAAMVHNPVEVTGVVWGRDKVDEYRICSEIVIRDPNVDILLLPVGSGIPPEGFKRMVTGLRDHSSKPIAIVWIEPFGDYIPDLMRDLVSIGVPVYRDPISAARALHNANTFYSRTSTPKQSLTSTSHSAQVL